MKLNPDMQFVLDEVLDQDRSRLLGRGVNVRETIGEWEPISTGEPFLSKAERKLLDSYRCELAEYLLQKGGLGVLSMQRARDSFDNGEETRTHARRVIYGFAPMSVELDKLVPGPNPHDMLVLAQRISPSRTKVECIAASHLVFGRPELARDVCAMDGPAGLGESGRISGAIASLQVGDPQSACQYLEPQLGLVALFPSTLVWGMIASEASCNADLVDAFEVHLGQQFSDGVDAIYAKFQQGSFFAPVKQIYAPRLNASSQTHHFLAAQPPLQRSGDLKENHEDFC